jgi:GPH family glycoside/pentoside/hexuronide:cation symporter
MFFSCLSQILYQSAQLPWVMGAICVVGGVGLAVAYLVPFSMIPDIIELDELRTGQRREGLYFALYVFFEKLGLGVALALSGKLNVSRLD